MEGYALSSPNKRNLDIGYKRFVIYQYDVYNYW